MQARVLRQRPVFATTVEFGLIDVQVDRTGGDVDGDLVAVFDKGDRSAVNGFRCDVADAQTGGTTREATVGAAGLALTGNGAWGAVLLVVSSIPSFAIYFYAERHGVQVDKLLSKGTMGQLVWPHVIMGVMVAALLFGIAFHLTTGHPLIPVPDVVQGLADNFSRGGTAPLSRGLIGGGIVALIPIAWAIVSVRRTKTQEPDPADIPDED